MRHIESEYDWLIPWAALQYFTGLRDAESERMRCEWIDRKRRRIVLPAEITKTGDGWVMDSLPPAFWKWVDAYPSQFRRGPVVYPSNREWAKIRNNLIAAGVFEAWPANGFRHTFATMHLSAHRDQSATSLLLRHQNPRRLWRNYLRYLAPKAQGLKYFSLTPS